ncbi:MAG: EAL domain-containing protein [Geminocystis sp.]|nr:EAL domain-containing protein [Geminocystis sp.]HIK36613.1 EAL domain-containing protein [Geminocystis sp. M7585_C2015_104]MCS7147931.1 EAL domain-containing protein [Geminocystis sp.]MCX8078758.1 EAL domain-containing protein [Geminocystis sp.]MDW8116874.1 EAL domain-containing protein [Geminocystis sp.]
MSKDYPFDVNPAIHVLVVQDDCSRRTIVLDEANYSIGRDPRNKIVLSSKKVSRFHATLLRRTDTKNRTYSYWLLDGDLQGNRSTNGIFINDKRCLVQELKHEDVISFGQDVQAVYYILHSPEQLQLLQAGDFVKPPELESTSSVAAATVERKREILEKSTKKTVVATEGYVEEAGVALASNTPAADVAKLASFPELSPNPIFELDWDGNITYLNPAATNKFPELKNNPPVDTHPLLMGLLKNIDSTQGKDNKLFVREVHIKEQVFEQYIHYLPERKLIRSYVFDYTRRKAIEAQLQETEERYRLFISQTRDGILLVDAQNKKILEANQAIADLLEYSVEELFSLKLYDLIDLTTNVLDKQIELILASKKEQNFVREFVYKGKNKLPVSLETSISWLTYGDQILLLFTIYPPHKQTQQQTYIQKDSLYDLETGLPTRQLFLEQLKTAIANSRRQKGLLSVIFLELEILEEGRDTLNYSLKSKVLEGVGKRLRACLREGDVICHWEGAVFACLLPRIRSARDAGRVSSRLLEALKPPFFLDHQHIYTRVYIGIAVREREEETLQSLIQQAQTALQKSKEAGGNNYKFADVSRQTEIDRFLRLERLLSYALERGEFRLYYQPQLSTTIGKITGVEALLRWQHPDLGLISAEQFLPMAEETGLIVPIGDWVIENACQQRRRWQEGYLQNQPICINISSQQLQQRNFVQKLQAILEKLDLPPSYLELEIQEKTIEKAPDDVFSTLEKLRDLGIRIALDDFGTSDVSFGYLKRFPFTTVKIDRPVIKTLLTQPQEKALVSAIMAFSRGLENVRIVAEGVEDKSQIEELVKLGCAEIQGNWLTAPLNPEEMTAFLNSHQRAQ